MRHALAAASLALGILALAALTLPQHPAPTSPPQEAYDAVWYLETARGHGTGFSVAQDGDRVWIATAKHVAGREENPVLRAVGRLGRELYMPRVEWLDEEHDLALMSFETDRQEPLLKLSGGPPPLLGETVWSVGYPGNAGFRVGVGAWSGGERMTAPIHFGNSGGPVLNVRGEVVAVVVEIVVAPTMMGDGTAVPHLGLTEPPYDVSFRLRTLRLLR